MASSTLRRIFLGLGCLLALWFGSKYVLPVALPFLVGGLLALVAEPLVCFSQRWLHLRRSLAAGFGVAITLLFLAGLLSLLGTLAVKELIRLAASIPDLEKTTRQGMVVLENWLVDLSHHAPQGIQPMLAKTVDQVLDDSSTIVSQVTQKIPGMLTGLLGGVSNGALGVGTGLLAAFMVSARLPRLRQMLTSRLSPAWKTRYLPALARTRRALGGWLRAQGLLALVTYAIVAVGFLFLRVPNGLFWAILIALLDAVPMLGTGLVLVPWALVCLLQGSHLRAIGLVLIVGCATIARSTLEPRLLGKELGIDPLVTLLTLYAGFQIWGFGGLIAAPVLAAGIKSLVFPPKED